MFVCFWGVLLLFFFVGGFIFPPKILPLIFSPLCLFLAADSFSKQTSFLLPSFSFSSSKGPGKRPSSCAPHPPKHLPMFFSLMSNSPLLNHPSASSFTSWFLFLSHLSHWCHLALNFSLPFFLLLFPLFSTTCRSSCFLHGTTSYSLQLEGGQPHWAPTASLTMFLGTGVLGNFSRQILAKPALGS